jgi:hypothetical protein
VLDVFQIMLNFLPGFSSNISIMWDRHFPQEAPYDNSDILRCYGEFMEKVDSRLISDQPITLRALTVFTKYIDPSRFKYLLEFHSSYLDKQQTAPRTAEAIIRSVRISSGISLAIVAHMQKGNIGTARGRWPSYDKNLTKIFELLQEGLDLSDSISPSQNKDLALLALTNVDLDDPERGFSMYCTFFKRLMQKELPKKRPDMNIIELMIKLMYKVYKESHLSSECKMQARDHILSIKGKIKDSLLKRSTIIQNLS